MVQRFTDDMQANGGNMTQRATTITEAYQVCNPDKPLPPDDLYVTTANPLSWLTERV